MKVQRKKRAYIALAAVGVACVAFAALLGVELRAALRQFSAVVPRVLPASVEVYEPTSEAPHPPAAHATPPRAAVPPVPPDEDALALPIDAASGVRAAAESDAVMGELLNSPDIEVRDAIAEFVAGFDAR